MEAIGSSKKWYFEDTIGKELHPITRLEIRKQQIKE
jgi:hypothetical protein